jgi:hypothetical protein
MPELGWPRRTGFVIPGLNREGHVSGAPNIPLGASRYARLWQNQEMRKVGGTDGAGNDEMGSDETQGMNNEDDEVSEEAR